jgi:hypothetical protein
LDPIGSLYIAELFHIWVIDQNGVIKRYAGSDGIALGDGGPALDAHLTAAAGLTFASDGTLFFIDNVNIRKVTPQASSPQLLATEAVGSAAMAARALSAGLGGPNDVAVRTRWQSLHPDIFQPRATRWPGRRHHDHRGERTPGFNGDNNLPIKTNFGAPAAVAIGSDGAIYISSNLRVRKIASA